MEIHSYANNCFQRYPIIPAFYYISTEMLGSFLHGNVSMMQNVDSNMIRQRVLSALRELLLFLILDSNITCFLLTWYLNTAV